MQPWTLGILKPDAVSNPITLKWINQAIFQNGLKIQLGCRMHLDENHASELYTLHKGKFYFPRLIRHMCSGPVVIIRLEVRPFNMPVRQSSTFINWVNQTFYGTYDYESPEPAPIFGETEAIERWKKNSWTNKVISKYVYDEWYNWRNVSLQSPSIFCDIRFKEFGSRFLILRRFTS